VKYNINIYRHDQGSSSEAEENHIEPISSMSVFSRLEAEKKKLKHTEDYHKKE
jgi:hypothetical protein